MYMISLFNYNGTEHRTDESMDENTNFSNDIWICNYTLIYSLDIIVWSSYSHRISTLAMLGHY